jgi:syntaxin 16
MLEQIQNKLRDLHSMHDKHINTPNLDQQANEERGIEILTSDITSVGAISRDREADGFHKSGYH